MSRRRRKIRRRFGGLQVGPAFALVFSPSLFLSILFLFGSFRDVLLRFVHDDAFYYHHIAMNWARGRASTFDGVTRTNGYHPLWQLLLIPVARIVPNCWTLARVSALLGVWLLTGSALLLGNTLGKRGNPFAHFAPLWIVASLLFATIYGMESPLAAFLFSLLIFHVAQPPRAVWRLRSGFVLGVIASLLFLTRIDSLPWLICMNASIFLRKRREQNFPRAFAMAVFIQTAVILAYFGLSKAIWGHFLPISALVKSARVGFFSFQVPMSLLALIAIAALPLSLWFLFAGGEMAWIGWGYSLSLALIFAKGGRETYNWYFTLHVVAVAVMLPEFLNHFSLHETFRSRSNAQRSAIPNPQSLIPRKLPHGRGSDNAQVALLVLCLAVGAVSIRGKFTKPSAFVESYDLAVALSKLGPGRYVFAATDCGILGCLSGQTWINLDGLTADFGLQNALRDDRLADWLDAHGWNACVVPKTREIPTRWNVDAPGGLARIPRSVAVEVFTPLDLGDRWRIMKISQLPHFEP